jgi:homocysteine S-methyltransferase
VSVADLLRSGPVLSEGSVFERLRRAEGIAFDPEVGIGALVADATGREALADVHRAYLGIGLERGLPVLLQTDTRHALPDRIARSAHAGADLNGLNAALLRELCDEASAADVLIGGLVGPLGDGYGGDTAPDAAAAERLLRPQAEALVAGGVDLLVAATLPDAGEALGIARALAATGLPYVIGVVARADGTLLDGTRLGDLVAAIDHGTPQAPAGYALTCVHPSVAAAAITAGPGGERVIACFANASALSPDEFDGRAELAAGEPGPFAAQLDALGLPVSGDCCRTDERHLAALADRLTARRA